MYQTFFHEDQELSPSFEDPERVSAPEGAFDGRTSLREQRNVSKRSSSVENSTADMGQVLSQRMDASAESRRGGRIHEQVEAGAIDDAQQVKYFAAAHRAHVAARL